jgi:protein-ribulosamine 3-kinase
MRTREDFSRVAAAIGSVVGVALCPDPVARVHGGSINDCYRWRGSDGSIFVKLASSEKLAAFEAEAAGLRELQRAQAIRVPEVLGVGASGGHCWIALEWIQFGPRASEVSLGEGLARLHRVTTQLFGWNRDNTIGSTPQLNAHSSDWVTFFRERRLRYQLELAASNGYGGRLQKRGVRLLDGLGELFGPYRPVPSLLHGDLWGGNWASDEQGRPVLFDPAVYYGDREADLAMTRLFGGFGPQFYSSYENAWPLDPGAPARIGLYNLYHVLNHLNLFGGGYLAQAESMIDSLLAEIRA